MKVRDGHARLEGDTTEYVMPSGSVEIVADDGRPILSITAQKDGSFRISAGMVCKHQGAMLNDRFLVIPIAANCIELVRPEYK